MLAVEGMLEALSGIDDTENYKNCNNDDDFGEVLEVCGGSVHEPAFTHIRIVLLRHY